MLRLSSVGCGEKAGGRGEWSFMMHMSMVDYEKRHFRFSGRQVRLLGNENHSDVQGRTSAHSLLMAGVLESQCEGWKGWDPGIYSSYLYLIPE